MCSIEEAWAGQTFDGYRVQSQADLHRKYMPIGDDLLTRNNEFSVVRKDPVSRMGNQGINTKMVRPLQLAQQPAAAPAATGGQGGFDVSFANNQMPMDNYAGLEPRPSYMSIYDAADSSGQGQNQGMPMPSLTQAQTGRSPFGDINQAFQVSPVVERFMARGGDSNPLQNENSNDDRLVLAKKFNSADANTNISQSQNHIAHQAVQSLSQVQASLQDILARLERVERELHHSANRNMCDMVLYVLVGMLIAFIVYSLLRK